MLLATAFILFSITVFLLHPQFGALPRGQRRRRVEQSAQFRDGKFQNLERTSVMHEDVKMQELLKYALFSPNIRTRPSKKIPSMFPDLGSLRADEDVLIWFGHSSYYLQVHGLRILVDPVFSGSVSPLKVTNRCFDGSEVVRPQDIPDLDILLITHDHWDHLDYATVQPLLSRTARVVTSLGVGSHLERWGCDPTKITELDWWESTQIAEGVSLTAAPARHFSGRLIRRARTLWSGFALKSDTRSLFLGGDSGYGAHFKTIGERLGPFDLAILECGQYDRHWQSIHMMPEQSAQAALDLGARALLPVHWAKFVLSKHAWDDPILRVSAEASKKSLLLHTPRIGEILSLQNPQTRAWWAFEA